MGRERQCRTESQWRTNETLVALQKRKLDNCQMRPGDETRAFRPEIPEKYEPETDFRRANMRNFGSSNPRKLENHRLCGWANQDVAFRKRADTPLKSSDPYLSGDALLDQAEGDKPPRIWIISSSVLQISTNLPSQSSRYRISRKGADLDAR